MTTPPDAAAGSAEVAEAEDIWTIADRAIQKAYPDVDNKGVGWWGAQRIPNWGALRGAIALAVESLSAQSEALRQKSDAEMLRVKACEHIALGDEGWERLRNECPSTAAVAALRDEFSRMRQENADMQADITRTYDSLQKETNARIAVEAELAEWKENARRLRTSGEAAKVDAERSSKLEQSLAEELSHCERDLLEREDPGTLKMMTALVERAYGIFTAAGVLRVAEQDQNSNDPIVAWASDVRSILYRNRPAEIDADLRAARAAVGKEG